MSRKLVCVRGALVACLALGACVAARGDAQAADTVSMTIVHQFDASPGGGEGALPGTVAFGRDGAIYGTTAIGGIYDAGTIFRVGPDGKFATIYTFRGPDGTGPNRCLIPGADGNLYGTIGDPATSDKVRVFRVSPTGVLTLLAVFYPSLRDDDERAVVVRATDGQRYLASSTGGNAYDGSASFQLAQQAATAGGTPVVELLTGRPRLATAMGQIRSPAGVRSSPSAANSALCGNINPARDGHFWLSPLVVDTRGTGMARSVSTDLNDGYRAAIPMYKAPPAATSTETPGWRAAAGVSGRLAEDLSGVMLGTSGEHEIIGVSVAGEIARHIPLEPLGDKIYSVMGLLRARDGYFYGLALVDGYDGTIMVYRTTGDGPPETFYRFLHSGPRETIKSPLVEGPDGSLYVTTTDGGKDRRGAIYRITTRQ
jgi:uncharacterized repeat protein (TIGR03803 family)